MIVDKLNQIANIYHDTPNILYVWLNRSSCTGFPHSTLYFFCLISVPAVQIFEINKLYPSNAIVEALNIISYIYITNTIDREYDMLPGLIVDPRN